MFPAHLFLKFQEEKFVRAQPVFALLAMTLHPHRHTGREMNEQDRAARLIHLLPAVARAADELLAELLRLHLQSDRKLNECRRECDGPFHASHSTGSCAKRYNQPMPLPQSGSSLHADRPFSFILFGASGHLAQLKIYPALYVLALKKRLPADYAIVGFARTEMSDAAFRDLVSASIRKDMIEVNEKILAEMLTHIHYHSGQYDVAKDYTELGKKLETLEKGTEDWIRIAYLSVPPTVFTPILDGLCAADIHDSKNAGSFRCIIEKPVGHDLASFEQLKKKLLACFTEKEIYLLDHYLGKEAVRNIYYLRFANPVLERMFKNTLIHHVEVTASEPHGIEERAGYFEHTGTFRDMIQSHLLMMVSLLTMRLTEDMDSLRAHRLNALEQFYLPPAKNLEDVIMQGQYGSGENKKGKLAAYRNETQVAKDSRTNTFVAMKLRSRMSRWEGVPFVMRTGKRLDKREGRQR